MEHDPAQQAACECLSTAWALRQLVVPLLSDRDDLLALSSAFAPALATPCYQRLCLLVQPPARPRPASSGHPCTGVAALLAHLSALPAPGHLQRLLRLCPALAEALRAPSGALLACALSAAARAGSLACMRALASAEGLPGPALAAAAPVALVAACAAGGGCAGDVVRALGCAPLGAAGACGPGDLAEALLSACKRGCVEAAEALAGPPYRADRRHLFAADRARSNGVELACASGSVALLELLAREPFCARREDLGAQGRWWWGLKHACSAGLAGVVARLARPPFALGRAEARQCHALRSGCWSAAVLDVLAAEPYGLGHDDASDATVLWMACRKGSAAGVRRLARAPYCLGRDDALVGACNALDCACQCGSVDVLDALCEPPYSLAGADIRATHSRALATACESGQPAVIRRLAMPPYGLGNADVRASGYEPLRVAFREGRLDVVLELTRPPYSIGQAEARESSALLSACTSGASDVVRLLAREPFSLDSADASAQQNIALLYACLSGSRDTVRALSQPPYSLEVDVDRPETIAAAMENIGVPLGNRELRSDLNLELFRFLRGIDDKRALSFVESHGAVACSALLRSLREHQDTEGISNALQILYDTSTVWGGCDTLPDFLPGVLVATLQSLPAGTSDLTTACRILLVMGQSSQRIAQMIVQAGGVEALQSCILLLDVTLAASLAVLQSDLQGRQIDGVTDLTLISEQQHYV
eukprot:m51a1_g9533 hypothetical protein (713) ;mRNA; f:806476-808963